MNSFPVFHEKFPSCSQALLAATSGQSRPPARQPKRYRDVFFFFLRLVFLGGAMWGALREYTTFASEDIRILRSTCSSVALFWLLAAKLGFTLQRLIFRQCHLLYLRGVHGDLWLISLVLYPLLLMNAADHTLQGDQQFSNSGGTVCFCFEHFLA